MTFKGYRSAAVIFNPFSRGKVMERFKTGQKCPKTGYWQWDGYADGSRTPVPSHEQRYIPLEVDETFPPCNDRGAYWVWHRN